MAGSITLQAPDVNSGTAVTLPGSVVNYAWTNLSNTTPIPGKFGTTETDIVGFENPKIIVTGTIDIGDIPSNSLTLELLKSFAKVQFDGTTTTALKLTIQSGADGTTPVPIKDAAGSNSYAYVIIEGFNFTFDTNVRDERRGNYSITFTETSVRS